MCQESARMQDLAPFTPELHLPARAASYARRNRWLRHLQVYANLCRSMVIQIFIDVMSMLLPNSVSHTVFPDTSDILTENLKYSNGELETSLKFFTL